MNNSTRNLKMKKLLIATTALVATAGMASADITISGHAAAGIYSGLGNKDGVAKNVAGKVFPALFACSRSTSFLFVIGWFCHSLQSYDLFG